MSIESLDAHTLNESELLLVANMLEFQRSLYQRGGAGVDPSRNIDGECHYPDVNTLTAVDYRDLYDKFGVAERVVHILPDETWGINPEIYDEEKESIETPFEKAWKDLNKGIDNSMFADEEASPIWEVLKRADQMSGIGRFGVILLGLGVPGSLEEPLPGFDDKDEANQFGFVFNAAKVPKKKPELLYLRAFDESLVDVAVYENRRNNRRYGLPIEYNITLSDPMISHEGIGHDSGREVRVHWSRVIHIADNLSSSEIYGKPRQQSVYHHLLDLRKLYGGSAEMYWQGAFPGLSFETHPQLGNTIKMDAGAMKDQVQKYFNGLQRYLAMTGATAKTLSPQVVDPTNQIERTIDAICIKLGVPKRIFIGSERGELASSQDADAWSTRLKRRRLSYVSPRIIKPLVDRLIQVGVLPVPKDKQYHIKWNDAIDPTPTERAGLAAQRMQAVSAYLQSGADVLIPPITFLVKELDYDREEAEEILEEAAKISEEQELEEKEAQAEALKQQQAIGPPQPDQQSPQPPQPGKVPPQLQQAQANPPVTTNKEAGTETIGPFDFQPTLNTEEGVWRTTETGAKIFIKDGEVRAGGPDGPILEKTGKSAKKESQSSVKELTVYTGGSGKEGTHVTYHATNKAMAESYVTMYNERFGSGGSLHTKKITIENPASEEVVLQVGKTLGMDVNSDGYTPASIFDNNLYPDSQVKSLITKLREKGYDGTVLEDISYGTGIQDKAYITFTKQPEKSSPSSSSPKSIFTTKSGAIVPRKSLPTFVQKNPKSTQSVRYLKSRDITFNSANSEGIWRTTEDGSKIFIKDGEVRAGGPNGPILSGSSKESSDKPKFVNELAHLSKGLTEYPPSKYTPGMFSSPDGATERQYSGMYELDSLKATVYRVGNIEKNTERGGTFFSGDSESIKGYAADHEGHSVQAYEVSLGKVVVAGHQNDLTTKWFGKSYGQLMDAANKKYKKGTLATAAFDKKLANEAKKRGYEGIVYVVPAPPAKTELMVIGDPSKKVKPKQNSTSPTINSENGIWRTTEDGQKIFIKDGEVRAGGPNGPVLDSKEKETSKNNNSKISPKIIEQLKQYSFDEIKNNKQEKIQKNLQEIVSSLGLKTKISVIDDAQFNAELKTAAEKAGVSPQMIQAVYFDKSDRILFRKSKVEAIQDNNTFRLFNNVAYHELGHAYESKVLGATLTQVKSVEQYDNSKREEYADTFSSRMTLVQKKAQGTGLVPKSLRQRTDDHNFISETQI